MFGFFTAFLALCLDRVLGEPPALWSRLPHPVVLMGQSITAFEQRMNKPTDSFATQKQKGILALVVLILLWVGGSVLILSVLPSWLNSGVTILGGAIFIAHKSLIDHVQAVVDGLTETGLTGGRQAVAMIVGRDPESLDEPAVCRAAIESAAENFSDGVVAPVFWLWLFGLPGLIFYKLVNTADSMIGHRTARYEAFGWAPAKVDDFINLPASRLSAVLIVLAAWWDRQADHKGAWMAWRRDAHSHKSPNAGHPEAAMAGALDIALAGPRQYGDRLVDDPFMHAEGRKETSTSDITRAISVLNKAWWALALCLFSGWWIFA